MNGKAARNTSQEAMEAAWEVKMSGKEVRNTSREAMEAAWEVK